MLKSILAYGRNHLLNISGEKVGKRIVVFESDDWGSIRMPSQEVYRHLINSGISLNKNPYNRFDSLETADDFEALYSVLTKFSDHKGNAPILTANFIMANPDFDKIASSNFESYYFESFRDTYQRSNNSKNSWDILQQGIRENLIKPQFHGREHLNVNHWLNLLKQNHRQVKAAFEQGVFCLDLDGASLRRENLMASFDYSTNEEKQFIEYSVVEGLQMFEENFGYKSASMIAPCNVWGNHIEVVAAAQNVKFIQSLRGRNIPQPGPAYKRDFPVMGQQNKNGQFYLVRNVYFEPATSNSYNWVNNAIAKIEAAFFWNKPAVISSHRLNFAGTMDPENRARNLAMLSELLSQIMLRWPDVEFMSTDALGAEYEHKNINRRTT